MPIINHLPPEILRLVFMLFHQNMDKGEVDIGLLTAVSQACCKYWQDLALSTPEFWSSIEITIPDWNLLRPPYSKISSWLERSRNQPLSIVVAGVGDIGQTTSTAAIFQLLLRHSHWWRHISFTFGPYCRPVDVDIPANFIAPILESVKLVGTCWHEPTPSRIFSERLLRGSPTLRGYAYQLGNLSELLPKELPLEQLRSLDLGIVMSQTNALIILERAVNLQRCCLPINNYDGPLPKPVTSSITCLSLELSFKHGENAKKFFRLLDAHSLTTLSIHFHCWDRDTQYEFLSNPHPRLSSLTIINITLSEDQFLDRLTVLSESITTLRILKDYSEWLPVDHAIKNKILNLLTFRGEGTPKPLCPLLENLALDCCISADDGVLANMVQSRRRFPQALRDHGIALMKRLDIGFRGPLHISYKEGLEKLYGEGLRGCVKDGILGSNWKSFK